MVSTVIENVQTWIDAAGPAAAPMYVVVYAIAAVALVPGSILTLLGGAVFGPVLGALLAVTGATAGAAIAFLIARYLARGWVERRAGRHPKFTAIDQAIGQGGWRVVALLRLSPVIPFNLQNYFYGITRIGFWPCVLTSWVAMLPGAFLYAYIGHLGVEGIQAAASGQQISLWQWVLRVAGLLATIAVVVYITLLARRALRSADQRIHQHS